MMQQKDYLLGVDIGTSSTKALAVYPDGRVGEQHQIGYKTKHPQPGYSEQDPDQLLEAVIGVIREAVEKMNHQPMGVSFSFAMHSLMAVDKKGDPSSPLIIWSDYRSQKEAAAFKQKDFALSFYQHTGTPIHAMSPFCKLIWWGKHQADSFQKAAKFISIQEYIFSHFFGEYKIGYSLASATGLFNHRSLDWYKPALDFVGITTDKLSQPVPSTHICKGLRSECVHQTGLEKSTPFVIGAGDGCLANLGTGVLKKGKLAATIGTSGAVRLFGHKPVEVSDENRGGIFNYLLTANEYISGGAINNGGILLDWFRFHFMKRDDPMDYKEVLKLASQAPPGCNGLLFLPYLYGERAPMWDAQARGAFIGIAHHHEQQHFARAVIEGIGYALYQNVRIIRDSIDYDLKEVYVSGGFTRSQEWVQMLADIFEKEVKVSGKGDASSVGAAILGMKAFGLIKAWEEAAEHISITATFEPNARHSNRYQRNYSLFSKMYDVLCPAMHEIGQWQEGS